MMRKERLYLNLPFAASGYECLAEIYALGGEYLVVLKDIGKNLVGITNAVEHAATAALSLIDEPVRLPDGISFVQVTHDDRYAEVLLEWDASRDAFVSPKWRQISPEDLEEKISKFELLTA